MKIYLEGKQIIWSVIKQKNLFYVSKRKMLSKMGQKTWLEAHN